MTVAILIAISCMWLPLALFLLGKGEAKTTGWICGLVGILVVTAAVIHAGFLKDNATAGLLFAHGLLYIMTMIALVTGVEDLRTVANVSLTVAIISLIYCLMWLFGGPVCADGKVLFGQNNYFALAAAGYTVLTLEVWGFGYGKVSGPLLAWSLIIWVVVGLWIPAFSLMLSGTLPLCH